MTTELPRMTYNNHVNMKFRSNIGEMSRTYNHA